MHYLAAGLCCLLAVAFGGGRAGWAAAALALAGIAYAFLVYRWWVPPAAAVGAAVAGLVLSRLVNPSSKSRAVIGCAGAILTAFSVLGPRDGLF